MKAEELRLDNFINHKEKGLIQIKGIEPHCGDFKLRLENEEWLYLKNCKPIPLTEEWLVKFGFVGLDFYFESNLFSGYQRGNEFPELSFYIGANISDAWEVYIQSSYQETIQIKYIKHVHQLQNLYFALTGKELTMRK